MSLSPQFSLSGGAAPHKCPCVSSTGLGKTGVLLFFSTGRCGIVSGNGSPFCTSHDTILHFLSAANASTKARPSPPAPPVTTAFAGTSAVAPGNKLETFLLVKPVKR